MLDNKLLSTLNGEDKLINYVQKEIKKKEQEHYKEIYNKARAQYYANKRADNNKSN